VGRTGRAGRSGTAISLVSPADEKSLTAIEKLTGQNIPRSAPLARPSDDRDDAAREERGGRDGHRRGRRKESPKGSPTSRGQEPRSQESRSHDGPSRGRHDGAAKERRHEAPAKRPAPEPVTATTARRPQQPASQDRAEPADHSHLPAFLLRPIKARA